PRPTCARRSISTMRVGRAGGSCSSRVASDVPLNPPPMMAIVCMRGPECPAGPAARNLHLPQRQREALAQPEARADLAKMPAEARAVPVAAAQPHVGIGTRLVAVLVPIGL